MSQELTSDQQAAIIVNHIVQATKDRIINILEPQFDRISAGHYHFDKRLADAIINDIKNA